MERHHVLALVLACSAVSGIFSPYLQIVVFFAPLWMPSWLPPSPGILFYLASLITATTILLVSGIPAAIAERLAPALRQGNGGVWVWFAGAALLTAPALTRLAGS
jgi:hypothetical protein